MNRGKTEYLSSFLKTPPHPHFVVKLIIGLSVSLIPVGMYFESSSFLTPLQHAQTVTRTCTQIYLYLLELSSGLTLGFEVCFSGDTAEPLVQMKTGLLTANFPKDMLKINLISVSNKTIIHSQK